MGNLAEHAKRELALINAGDGELYGGMLVDAVVEIVEAFGNQGHSGMSASIVVSFLEKLLRFEPLSPLQGTENEWIEVESADEKGFLLQNNRCSHVFKNQDGAYDIDGRIFREPDGNCYTSCDSRVPIVFPYIPKREYIDVEKSES